MNIKELTELLTDSSESFQNHKFIPWWTDDYENYIYPYDIFEREIISEAEACLEKCSTEALLAPVVSASPFFTFWSYIISMNR